MVTMKAQASFRDNSVAERPRRKKGRPFECDEQRARDLEVRGLAIRIEAKAEPGAPSNKMEPPPENKEHGQGGAQHHKMPAEGSAGPLSRTGGATGAERSPSSSPAGHQPRRPASRKPAGEPGS